MKPSKGLTRPKAAPKVAPKAAAPKMKVVQVPQVQRYSGGKLDPKGTEDKFGFPLPAASLPQTAAQKKAEAATQAAATQKKVRADREAARRAGFKE